MKALLIHAWIIVDSDWHILSIYSYNDQLYKIFLKWSSISFSFLKVTEIIIVTLKSVIDNGYSENKVDQKVRGKSSRHDKSVKTSE